VHSIFERACQRWRPRFFCAARLCRTKASVFETCEQAMLFVNLYLQTVFCACSLGLGFPRPASLPRSQEPTPTRLSRMS